MQYYILAEHMHDEKRDVSEREKRERMTEHVRSLLSYPVMKGRTHSRYTRFASRTERV